MRWSVLVAPVAVLLWSASLLAQGPTTAPTTQPADGALYELAERCAEQWQFETLRERVEVELAPLLRDLKSADRARLARLASLREFCRYSARIETPSDQDRAAVALLARQPKLMQSVMLGTNDADAPDRVLQVLAVLQAERGMVLERAPELAAAVCVVFDDVGGYDDVPPQTERARWVFNYLLNARRVLRVDPLDLPMPLLTYVVEIKVSQPEVLWALRKYAARGTMEGVYFDVPYDVEAFYGGRDKRIDAMEYTLENLSRFGGICTDQAYFATQVSRILGVPAVTVVGQGGGGDVAHAWMGFFDSRNRRAAWNFRSGRYETQLYWTGQLEDPQTRRTISEAHLALLAELATTAPADRSASRAIFKSLDLVDESLRGDALMFAIDLCPAHRDAWLALADLAAEGKLSPRQVTLVAEVTRRFASGAYPDFALDVFRRLISGLSTDEQLAKLDWIAEVLKNRIDLSAAVRVEQAKLLRAMKRDDEALKVLGEVLTKSLLAGPVVVDALGIVDDLLERRDLPRLLSIYRQTWSNMPRPLISYFSAHTPWVRVGARYAMLLQRSGKLAEAASVNAQVGVYVKGTGAPSRR